eukprot:3356827-Prymnesium_polylepis.1
MCLDSWARGRLTAVNARGSYSAHSPRGLRAAHELGSSLARVLSPLSHVPRQRHVDTFSPQCALPLTSARPQ